MSKRLKEVIGADSFDINDGNNYDRINFTGVDKEEESEEVDMQDAGDVEVPEEADEASKETNEDTYEDMDDAGDSKYDEMAKEVDAENIEAPAADTTNTEPTIEDVPNEDDLSEYKDESSRIPSYDGELLGGADFDGSVDTPLIASIKEADIGKPTTPEEALTNMVSLPVNSADLESFAKIAGVAGLGYKKVSETFNGIKSMFTVVETGSYDNLAKGFIFTSKEKKFKDYYSYLIGVPMGLTGYLKDISGYVAGNAIEVDRLIVELDKGFDNIAKYVNSKDERETFVADVSYIKNIETKALDMLEKNKMFITKGTSDTRTIGSLLRNSDDVKVIIADLKATEKIVKLEKLDTIKRKINAIDELITTMVANKSTFSTIKIKEVSRLIDGLIGYTNGVATMVYLKNSLDIIMLDIKKLI